MNTGLVALDPPYDCLMHVVVLLTFCPLVEC